MANQGNFTHGFPFQATHSVSLKTPNPSPSRKKQDNRRSPKKNRRRQVVEEEVHDEVFVIPNIGITTDSISKLLDSHHLNAGNAATLNDLQCGSGDIVLQVLTMQLSILFFLNLKNAILFFCTLLNGEISTLFRFFAFLR